MSRMDKPTRQISFWMITALWFSLCILGMHFLADNAQHASIGLDARLPVSQGDSETFDEHQLETNFIIPDEKDVISPLALVTRTFLDRAFAPLLFVIPFLKPPRG